jgi:hypothetical protein
MALEEVQPCFIITPIGQINSDTYLKAVGLIKSVIEPILKEFNLYALPAYSIADSGSINKQILKNLISNKLVIANLTGLNPNVMYELAVRHAVRLPIIIMAEDDTKLPFDITDQRTIFYTNTHLGSENAKPLLRAAIEAALNTSVIDNPIYQAYQEESIIQSLKLESTTIDKYLLSRIGYMEDKLNLLVMQTANSNIPNNNVTVIEKNISSVQGKFKDENLDQIEATAYLMSILNNAKIKFVNIKLDQFNLTFSIYFPEEYYFANYQIISNALGDANKISELEYDLPF